MAYETDLRVAANLEAVVTLRIPNDALSAASDAANQVCEDIGVDKEMAPVITRAIIKRMKWESVPASGSGTEVPEH